MILEEFKCSGEFTKLLVQKGILEDFKFCDDFMFSLLV